ncbi:cilia- and flagella-associated protein 157-like [Daktulosphaira vitifoliae]|uniref:cilia- and flagella-associated protein 157-like n=1 Tax=Daktulosphaira vitifoliae TaxID=58002 RepID=UPI0021A9CB2F|nr:cilia- and flagella-associated protein 157-like [Daktulosphaira vitifoliae]
MYKTKRKQRKKKKNEDKEAVLQEVDKAMYNVQIADLTEKLTRINRRCTELEQNADADKEKTNTLIESHRDIIAYLSRQVEMKNNEIVDMDNTITTMKSTIEHQKLTYENVIAKKDSRFETVFGQLTAEIGLLKSKVNSLNEFKKQRSELIEKFLKQEEELSKIKTEKDNLTYETDKKIIIVKEQMKRQNEEKLSQLSTTMQSNLQKLMMTTFERTLKENSVVKKELNECVKKWLLVNKKYEQLKSENFDMKVENKMFIRENSRLNRIITAQKVAIDTLNSQGVYLNWKFKNTCTLNNQNQNFVIKSKCIRYIAAISSMQKKLKNKNRRIKGLMKNLKAMKREVVTLSSHIYKMDSLFVTITNSMERKLELDRLRDNSDFINQQSQKDSSYYNFLKNVYKLFVETKLRRVEIQEFNSAEAVKVSLLDLNKSKKSPTYSILKPLKKTQYLKK